MYIAITKKEVFIPSQRGDRWGDYVSPSSTITVDVVHRFRNRETLEIFLVDHSDAEVFQCQPLKVELKVKVTTKGK